MYIHLFYLIFFYLCYISYALTYEDCLGFNFNQTNFDLYGNDPIYNGRYENCTINCDQRIYYGKICSSEISVHFDIWSISQFIGFLSSLFYNVYCLKIMLFSNNISRPKINLQYITIFINFISSIIFLINTILILFDIYNDFIIFSLIRLGQCLIFSEIFSLNYVWKSIINSSVFMKQINNNTKRKHYNYSLGFVMIIMLIIYPFSIISLESVFLFGITNCLLGIFCIGLIISSFFYSKKITKILESGIQHQKRRKTIINIKIIVYIFTICGLINVILNVLYMFGFFNKPIIKVYAWWFPISFTEIIMLHLIAYGTSQKARIGQNILDNLKITIKKSLMFNNKIGPV